MDIEKLAREAGLCEDAGRWFTPNIDPLSECDVDTASLARFAALVVEECAKVCEEQVNGYNSAETLSSDVPWEAETKGEIQMAAQCAREVRSLIQPSNTKAHQPHERPL